MTRQIAIPGFKLKGTKVERDPKRLSASKQLQIKASRKIRPARRGQLR
jgi:hypothetical protein